MNAIAGQPEKIILEIIQVPGNRLAIKARARVADFVIHVAPGFHLEARQHLHHLYIGVHHGGGNVFACAIRHQKLKQRGVAQVLLDVSAVAQIVGVYLRDGQAVTAEMARELQKRDILFPHVIQNADRAGAALEITLSAAFQPDDHPP